MHFYDLERFNNEVEALAHLDAMAEEMLDGFIHFCSLNPENVDAGKRPYIKSITNIKKLSKNEIEFYFMREEHRMRYDLNVVQWRASFTTYRVEIDKQNYPNKKYVEVSTAALTADTYKVIIQDSTKSRIGATIDKEYINLLYERYLGRLNG